MTKALMTEKQLQVKIEALSKKHTKKLTQYLNESEYNKVHYEHRLNNVVNDLFGIPYRKTLKVFKGSNLDFNPINGLGHSYGWYELTKVIKGKLVLNAYAYSSTTVRHISRVRQVIDLLELKAIEVQAPNGLQNIEMLQYEHAVQWAKLEVTRLNARKPNKYNNKRQHDLLTNAALIGCKPSKKQLNEQLVKANERRVDRLNQAKLDREKKRLADALSLVSTIPVDSILRG